MSVTIEVPAELYSGIHDIARRYGKSVNQVIIEALINLLDPSKKIALYLELHEKFLREFERFYDAGDLVQASEKLWGAITALLNAIGELKNMPHYTHRDYSEIIECVAEEVKNPQITVMFAAAERLHANFYHAFLKKQTFDALKEQVLALANILKVYIQKRARVSEEDKVNN